MKLNASSFRHAVAILLSVGLSAGLLAFMLHALDWASFRQELSRVKLAYLPLLILLMGGLMGVRALRWRELLPTEGRASLRDLLDATLLGFFASFVLPLRAGEVVRPWALTRWQPVSFSTSLASVVAERMWDALTLLVLLGITLVRLESVPDAVQVGARALGGICVVLFGLIIACYVAPDFLPRQVGRWLRRLGPHRHMLADRVDRIFRNFIGGLRVVQGPWHIARVALLSVSLWLLMATWYQVALWAFGEHPDWQVGMLLNLMIALAVAAPSAPGFIGTFQAGCLLALSAMSGYPREFAVAYSVVAHALQMAVVLVAGGLVLQLRGLRFAQLRTSQPPA
jgi:uncharacterized protein (TIRG00374 family)